MAPNPIARVRAAARARDAAQERFEEALRSAIGAGVSIRTVAEAAGLTHTRVGQIVGPVGPLRKAKR